MTFEEIKIDSSKIYAILKIVILVSIFLVVAINILAAASDSAEEDQNKKFLPGVNNVTDINWGTAYPAADSYDGNGYPTTTTTDDDGDDDDDN